jgi:hypothetical protein
VLPSKSTVLLSLHLRSWFLCLASLPNFRSIPSVHHGFTSDSGQHRGSSTSGRRSTVGSFFLARLRFTVHRFSACVLPHFQHFQTSHTSKPLTPLVIAHLRSSSALLIPRTCFTSSLHLFQINIILHNTHISQLVTSVSRQESSPLVQRMTNAPRTRKGNLYSPFYWY